MSVISDIKSVFSEAAGANDYLLFAYKDKSNTSLQINLYGVFEENIDQQNTVANKPLERSQFTSDSVQIKPVIIAIRCVIMPPEQLGIDDYKQLSDYIANQIQILRNYCNGTQLFTLANMYSFGIYEPLKLFGLRKFVSVDLTIPEVTLMFMQVQTTTATSYSTTNMSTNVAQPTNVQQIQTTS